MGDLTIIGPDWSLTYGRTRLSGFVGLPWEKQTPIDETFRVSPDMGRAGVIPANREPGDPPDGFHYPEMKVFIEAVRTGDASDIRSPYADGLQSLAVVLAMARSVESGQVEEVRV
jgi:predicted dehydrogenase